MKPLRRKMATAVLAVAMLAGMPMGVAGADGDLNQESNNVVVVRNFFDGRTIERAKVGLARTGGSKVNNQNIADARASCTDCRTVAVATQVVVVEGTPSDVQPVNAAIAINENCLRCETYAYARQSLIQSDRRVKIRDSAESRVESLADRIDEVSESGIGFPEMTAQLDSLFEEMVAVVRAEVERNGTDSYRTDRRRVDEDDN